jgi:Activator of Hsp90 ATPase homolog 1-like protein
VTVDIVPVGSGCELTLTHEGVLAEHASRTESGWMAILGRLAETVE